jgi:ABC-2 type transport system permease protein
MQIYFKYVKMIVKSFLQYRLALLLTTLGQLVQTVLTFFAMWLLFDRFRTLKGYTYGEVALTFCVTLAAFAFTECFFRGFDVFQGYIKQGTFDRVLLRPRSTIIQILGSNVEISRLGRLLVAGCMLAWAVTNSGFEWTPLKAVTLALMLISGVVIFAGVFILGATICFWTVDGLEFINIFTDGAREFASYPLTIYSKRVTQFFTFIIPYGCFNYLPLTYITGRSSNPLYALTPLLGIVFIIPCLLLWQWGVRHYLSTGN